MNKNTRASKKLGLTNNPTITLGTGVGRQIVARNANPIFKGTACNTARPAGKNKWVGAVKSQPGQGGGGF